MLHTVLLTLTVANCSASLAVQIVSAEKPVVTVRTITNVAQTKYVVVATVRQCALSGPEVLLPAL